MKKRNEKKKDYLGYFLICTIGCGVCLALFASCPILFFISLFIINYIAMGRVKK